MDIIKLGYVEHSRPRNKITKTQLNLKVIRFLRRPIWLLFRYQVAHYHFHKLNLDWAFEH